MCRFRSLLASSLLATFLVPLASAQAQAPHVGYVYPAGGQQGTSFQVKVGGQFLNGVSTAIFSGSGIQASIVPQPARMTAKEAMQLRVTLEELLKAKRDPESQKQIAEIRAQLAAFMKKPLNPAIGEVVLLDVKLAADAEPGHRELRLETLRGLSNPLVFCVGQLPEFREQGPPAGDKAKSAEEVGVKKKPYGGQQPGAGLETIIRAPMPITLPAVLNGQIMPPEKDLRSLRKDLQSTRGDVDRYQFQGRKGQQLVVTVSARELMPYLADAVPGWFQATVALYDANGKEVAYDDDYRFHPDPVLFYKVPHDGRYTIEIKDALYRGRADFVYRITVGELPFITDIFPLGCRAGTQATVELSGFNLPVRKVTLDARGKAPGIYPLEVGKGIPAFHTVPFAVDALPECLEKEPNDAPQNAQPVTLPVIINGRVGRPGDWDVFRFEGHAGQKIVAEVYARRLDSPLDSVLRLTDAAGKQLAFNDDHEDKGDGLNTHHADSLLNVTLPAKGTYYLHLGDAQQQGGPEYGYRLRISAPRPDFALRIVPSSLSAQNRANIPVTVYALRKDGFSGAIALALKDAPAGFTLAGGVVPAGQDQVRLTLNCLRAALARTVNLNVEGRATIAGETITRPTVPADDMMQAFAYRHLVPAKDLLVMVPARVANQVFDPNTGKSGKANKFSVTGKGQIRVVSDKPVKIPAGGTAEVRIALPANLLKTPVQAELSEPPEGISVGSVAPGADGMTVAFRSDADKAKPGLKGNLILNLFTRVPATTENGKTRPEKRSSLATLPALPFEIVQP